MLTEADKGFLMRLGYAFELHEIGAETHVRIKGVDVAERYAPRKTDLLFRLIAGYPVTSPVDSFCALPELLNVSDKQRPPNTSGNEVYFGQQWQAWSRHMQAWRPGVDSFETFYRAMTKELTS